MQSLFGQKLQFLRRFLSTLLLGQNAQPCLLRVQVLALDTQDLIHTFVEVLARQEVFNETHTFNETHARRTLAHEDTWLVVASLEVLDEVVKSIGVPERLLLTALLGGEELLAFVVV